MKIYGTVSVLNDVDIFQMKRMKNIANWTVSTILKKSLK